MNAALGIVGFIVFMAFGIAQLVVGFAGIEHGIGSAWAWVALFAAPGLLLVIPGVLASVFSLVKQ